MRKKLIFPASVTLLLIAAFFLFFPRQTSLPQQKLEYLTKTYPLADKKKLNASFFNHLDFYWYSAATKPFFHHVAKTVFPGSSPQFVCLAWMKSCHRKRHNHAVVRNRYHNGKKSSVRRSVDDGRLIEVYHNGWYRDSGTYYYALHGTGIFLNVGHTLIALNKLDALHKLGLSYKEIITLDGYAYNIDHHTFSTIRKLKKWAEMHHITFQNALNTQFKAGINGADYVFNHFADSYGPDYALYQLARKQGYDTVQMTAQPNSNGGWAFELLDVRAPMSASLNETWEINRQSLSQADPFDHKRTTPCHYKIPFKILRCDGT